MTEGSSFWRSRRYAMTTVSFAPPAFRAMASSSGPEAGAPGAVSRGRLSVRSIATLLPVPRIVTRVRFVDSPGAAAATSAGNARKTIPAVSVLGMEFSESSILHPGRPQKCLLSSSEGRAPVTSRSFPVIVSAGNLAARRRVRAVNPAEDRIRNISDTALWAAIYRARETERPDALFRDPFARRLAGQRGEEIANAIAFSNQNTWSWIARTYLFDHFITQEIAGGCDLVINLAAGLDARPYRMNLPASLQWIEIDLPGILDYKEEILRNDKPVCALERIRLDLSDASARREWFAKLGSRGSKALVISEGLIVYFTTDEVGAFARDLAG